MVQQVTITAVRRPRRATNSSVVTCTMCVVVVIAMLGCLVEPAEGSVTANEIKIGDQGGWDAESELGDVFVRPGNLMVPGFS